MTGRDSFRQTRRARRTSSMESEELERMRSAVRACIKELTDGDLREICNAHGADASSTLAALQAECISLLDDFVSRRDYSGLYEFRDRVFRADAHAPLLGSPQSHAGLQQFSGFTALDSSRIHAGNTYVGRQINYHSPRTPTPKRVKEPPALLKALEFPQMNLRRMNIEKEFTGTCTWLDSTEEHKRWCEPQSDDSHHMLWIKGIPGAGKSTIMKCAFSKEKASSPYMAIAFFFDAKGCDLAKSAEGMFRTLLCQLLSEASRDMGLPDMVTESEMEYFKKQGWPLTLLKALFRQAVMFRAKKLLKPVVSYIDALDEGTEDEVRELLTYFEDLAEEMSFSYRPRMCFSSRPYPNITIDRCETILLDRRPEHKNDIRRYLESRLSAAYLDVSEVSHHRGLISKIIENSSGVFLWVVLVTARLRKSADHGLHLSMLRKHLSKIPAALHDLFDTMIDQGDTNDCLLPIVQWVLFAQGRLRAIDLYFAVSFSTESLQRVTANSDWKSFDERWLRNFILTSSKGFLRVTDAESTSYMPCEFIHGSVREYFLDRGLRKLDPSLGSDVVAASHARLAQICQHYLGDPISKHHLASVNLHSTDAIEDSDALDPLPTLTDTTDDSDALDPAPLLAYIRDKGAFLHAEIADRNGIPQTDFCNNFAFDTWLTLLQYPRHKSVWRGYFELERDRIMRESNATSLHVLVGNQMESLVQRELQIHAKDDQWTLESYLNAECGRLGTALHLAVECNNIAIIRALTTSGADVDFRSETQETPLDYAIRLNRTDSIDVLLKLGARTASALSPHQRRSTLR